MQIVILISVLLVALVYLHVTQSSLIFQPDIKVAKTLAIIALVIQAVSIFISPLFVMLAGTAVRNNRRLPASGSELVVFGLLFALVIWILVILAYAKFFAGCYKAAYFKKTESVAPFNRAKIYEILTDASEQKRVTPEFKMFLQVNHEDTLVEAVRCGCGNLAYYSGAFVPAEQWEKLKDLAEKLKD
jgi:hypothetical protein